MKIFKKIVLVVLGLALVGGVVWFFKSRAQASAQATAAAAKAQSERKVPVLVETVIQRDLPIVLEGLGTVTPLATVTVRTQVDGRLDSVPFKEGAPVKKGDLLAQIDPRPFRIAVAQTSATLERDQAQLRNARLMLERYASLRKQDLVPQQQVDDQQTVVDQVSATLGIDQAVLDNAKLQLEYSRILSPIDGIAGIRQVDQGNLVHQADPTGIVVLAQLDPIAVIFSLP
jgi:multidrug efflux system membrane fusion protein